MARKLIISLPKFITACQAGTARGVFLGTSTTQGGNATAYSKRYVQLIAQKLSRKFTNSQNIRYFNPLADASSFSYTGSVTNIDKGLSLCSKVLAEGATMTTSLWCSAFKIYFVQGSEYPPFTLTIDNVDLQVTPEKSRTGDNHTGEHTISGLSYSAHTIKITAWSGGATICGFLLYDYPDANPDLGIQFFNSGHGGFKSANFVDQHELYQRIGAINPHFVQIMLGTNDYSEQIAPTIYQSNLTSIIQSIKNVAKNADILPVFPYKPINNYYSIPWASYAKATQLAAESNSCPFIDLTEYYPATAALDSANLIDVDNLHQTDAGHSYMARLLYAEMNNI